MTTHTIGPVRPSKQPLFRACPSSVLDDGPAYSGDPAVAALGIAAHKLLPAVVTSGVVDDADVFRVAKAHEVAEGDLAALLHGGLRAWKVLRRYFPDPVFEARMVAPLVGPCTADVLQTTQRLAVNDWKSGRVLRDYEQQVKAYAYAAAYSYGQEYDGKILSLVTWLQHGEIEVFEYSRDDLRAFEEEVGRSAQEVGEVYRPGEHCLLCPRSLRCQALLEYQRATVALLSGELPVQALSREALGAFYPRVQLLEKAIENYRGFLRASLGEAGPIPLDGRRQLELSEVERESIYVRAAWPVLMELGLTEDDMADILRVSKGALLDVVANRADKGNKGRDKAAAMERLRANGAVHVSRTTRMDVRMRKE